MKSSLKHLASPASNADNVSRAPLVRAVEGQLSYRRLQMGPHLVPAVFEALKEVRTFLGPSTEIERML